MVRLTTEKILKEQSRDRNAISALALTQRALSDVSCLSGFKSLERLDLSFNDLSSLEGLRGCENLKWLTVSQSKLQSLKGIEGLSKLHVLNAGKNMIKSMNEVVSLVSLRALILNDNEIVSICKLDHMKELNTLVLSRNPVCEIGESLAKVKTLTKLSLSKCHLQAIGTSLKFCSELKELRLAHNDIKALPAELALNKKLQNLDLGNNLISKWSDLKVLDSLPNLTNINLQGNPVMEKLSADKVKKRVPNLNIFNSKPLDKINRSRRSVKVDGSSMNVADGLNASKKSSKQNVLNPSEDDNFYDSGNFNMQKGLKQKLQKSNDECQETKSSVLREDGGKFFQDNTKIEQGEINVIDDGEVPFVELFGANAAEGSEEIVDKKSANITEGLVVSAKKSKKSKRRDINEKKGGKIFLGDDNGVSVASCKKRKKSKRQQAVGAIESGEALKGGNPTGGHAASPKKKSKRLQSLGTEVFQAVEIGLGGPSAWDD